VADLTRHLQEAARLATEVPSSEARAALLQAVTLAALLASRAAELAPEAPASAPVETHGEIATWINGEQALAQYGLSAGFLAEHRGELAQLGAVSKIGHRTFLYRATKLRAYIQSHLVTTGQDAC
jgi:hypothetical protein